MTHQSVLENILWILWKDRCDQQIEKEKNLGINKRLKNISRNNLTGKIYHSEKRNVIPVSIQRRGMEHCINYEGKLQDFISLAGQLTSLNLLQYVMINLVRKYFNYSQFIENFIKFV